MLGSTYGAQEGALEDAQHGRIRRVATSHSTAWHSTAWHSTAWHSTAWHSTAQQSRAWQSTVQRGTAQHSTAQRGMAWHSTAQRGKAQHSTHLMEASSSMAVIGSRKLVTSAMCTPSSRLPLGSSRTCSASSMSLQPGGSTLQMGRCLKSSLQSVHGGIRIHTNGKGSCSHSVATDGHPQVLPCSQCVEVSVYTHQGKDDAVKAWTGGLM